MLQTAAALIPGLALGGVLAASAAWSRSCRAGVVPHLGIGATAAVAVSAAVRFGHLPWPVRLVVAGAAGGGFGAAAEALDRRVGAAKPPWVAPPLTADVAVIGLAIAVAGLLTPAAAAAVSQGAFGVLGAGPGLAAAAAGIGVALLLAAPQPPGSSRRARWALTGAGLGTAAALAAGLLGGGPQGAAGLALRAAAAALAGRRDVIDAAGAGLALGLVEALLRGAYPLGQVAALPAAGAALLGLLVGLRRGDVPVATGGG